MKEKKFFAEKLKYKRLEKKLTQKELAELIGVKDSAITQYEKGKREPKMNIIFKLAEALGVSIDYFNNNDYGFTPAKTTNQIIKKPIAHIGSASCGFGLNNIDTITEWFDIPTSWIKGNEDDYFLCNGVGDSMIDVLIANGSILLCKQQSTLESGQIGAFVLNNEDYIKRFKKKGDIILLESANSKYESIIISKDDDFRIVGRVLKIITDIK